MTCRWLVMRHSEAQGHHPQGDAFRSLTEQGNELVAERCRDATFLQHLAQIDLVIVSPYVRAQQTAKLLQPYCSQATWITDEGFTPLSPPAQAIDLLKMWAEQHEAKHGLLVAHMPLVCDIEYGMTQQVSRSYALAEWRVMPIIR